MTKLGKLVLENWDLPVSLPLTVVFCIGIAPLVLVDRFIARTARR